MGAASGARVRYIGNKTRLLGEIERAARTIGFDRGRVCDLFAGTGVVGRYFRGRGNTVLSTDMMYTSHAFQKVFLETEEWPSFERLRRELGLDPSVAAPTDRVEWLHPRSPSEDAPLFGRSGDPVAEPLPGDPNATLEVIGYLETEIPTAEGVLTRQYSPDGPDERRFLRPERARHLDAILFAIRDWREREWLTEAEEWLLLVVTIDAADRVANISGTYGAFLKHWHGNTSRPIELRIPRLVGGPKGAAHRGAAEEWLGGVEADLLYIDPPYNHRQYPANYNLLEVMARIPREEDVEAFEGTIYGKSGLTPWKERASLLCSQRGTDCFDAMRELLSSTSIPRVVISYNEEGILSRDQLDELLAEYAGVAASRLSDHLTEVPFPRFRSDADGRRAHTGAVRNYRQLPGRGENEVHEWLFHVERKKRRRASKRATAKESS